ncbi:MAG: class I SAM-dependent methyltransferase [Candidatus Neomarinimicrobiota bacterium]
MISPPFRTLPVSLLFHRLSFPLFLLFSYLAGATDSEGLNGQEPSSEVYHYASPSKDGTGKIYMGREIARMLDHSAAGWLDRPDREAEEKPDLLVRSMNLRPTDVVADIGAGSGYFSFRMGVMVNEGHILAVEIQPEMLALIETRAVEKGVENVIPVFGTPTDPSLPDTSVHKVLMVDTYHEFSHPREMMEAIVRALKPEGLVFLIEYHGEEPELRIKPLHKMTEVQARMEMEAVGLKWLETRSFLPHQHVMIFKKQ